jgi:hypothetical protein
MVAGTVLGATVRTITSWGGGAVLGSSFFPQLAMNKKKKITMKIAGDPMKNLRQIPGLLPEGIV